MTSIAARAGRAIVGSPKRSPKVGARGPKPKASEAKKADQKETKKLKMKYGRVVSCWLCRHGADRAHWRDCFACSTDETKALRAALRAIKLEQLNEKKMLNDFQQQKVPAAVHRLPIAHNPSTRRKKSRSSTRSRSRRAMSSR
jgi:hypothetical protein